MPIIGYASYNDGKSIISNALKTFPFLLQLKIIVYVTSSKLAYRPSLNYILYSHLIESLKDGTNSSWEYFSGALSDTSKDF